MATLDEQRRVTKRSTNACSRCRRQKIKCSGLQPCANCSKRGLDCVFDDRDMKVLVTQGYLADLQQKLARLEGRDIAGHHSSETQSRGEEVTNFSSRGESSERRERTGDSSPQGTRDSSPPHDSTNLEAVDLTNPLLETPSKFMSSSSGRSFYLGTSSNWSFHGQVLSLVHEHIHRTPLSGADLLFDASAYDLAWDGIRATSDESSPIIPSIDHALFLINAVKFHCGQLVHLFDEEIFMFNLNAFYASSEGGAWTKSLWYIHFLLIIAFGKTFAQRDHQTSHPLGIGFFVYAMQLLPDTSALCADPMQAAEILCCKSLYLQALDARNAAYATIGQAVRISLAEGMHTDMPVAHLGEAIVQRCRKIWWTTYILDRRMSALMGLPQTLLDEDISCRLPTFSGADKRVAALNMQIKLARIYADIATTIYGEKGRLRKRFLLSIKHVLKGLVQLVEELRCSFPLHAYERLGGISRLSAHLHLLYYQMIIVVTRPLILCCLKKMLESAHELQSLVSSSKIRNLLQMSSEAAQQNVTILDTLRDQGLLESFLPWDLDALFVSTMVLILLHFVEATLLERGDSWLDKAFNLLDILAASGNRIAKFRICELRKLEEMLSEYSAMSIQGELSQQQETLQVPRTEARRILSPPSVVLSQDNMAPFGTVASDESSGFGDELSAEQILAFTDSLDFEDTDWLAFPLDEVYSTMGTSR